MIFLNNYHFMSPLCPQSARPLGVPSALVGKVRCHVHIFNVASFFLAMPVAVGVDLGSTHCNVGVWHQGRPEVIANHHGLRATPTMVAFTDSEVLVGEAALSQMPKNVANTVTGFKWMVGQKHAQLEPHIKAMLGESRVVWGSSEHFLEEKPI